MSIKCSKCIYIENDPVFGLCCTHRASMEGIEANKAFYTPNEVEECKYYNDESCKNCTRHKINGGSCKGTWFTTCSCFKLQEDI